MATSSESAPPILQLSNELLTEVFIRVDDPHTYLALSEVCHRFRSCAMDRTTRQNFVKLWFATHCNDQPDQAPSLIEYAARYVRRHCKITSLEEGCYHQFICKLEGDDLILISSPPESTYLWKEYILRGSNGLESYLGSAKYRWVEGIVERMAETTVEPVATKGKLWTLESVTLDIEDAVFANVLYKLYRSREDARWKLGIPPDPNVWKDHTYLGGMEIMRDEYICLCGSSQQEEDWWYYR